MITRPGPIAVKVGGTITGEGKNHTLGYSVAPAGDVNGDGIDDVIVGAPGYENGTGLAYIFFGGGDITRNFTADDANVTISTNNSGDRLGMVVAGAGDFNYDGYDDVMISKTNSKESPAGWWDKNWFFRKKLIFNNSAQSEALKNFTVLVKLEQSNFNYSKTCTGGTDLRFIDGDNSTVLNYHIENWNSSGSSYVWVNVTEIPAGTDSDYIWMYYGNPSASDVQDSKKTYDRAFQAVWHLNESAGPVLDATINAHNGTAIGGVTRNAQGAADGAYDFDGSDDYIDYGNDAKLMLAGDVTLESWIKIDTQVSNFDYAILQHGDSGETEEENWLYLFVLTPGTTGWDVDVGHEYGKGKDEKYTYNADLSLDTWYYLVATRDLSEKTWRLFIDGSQYGSNFSYTNNPTGGSLGTLMAGMDWYNLAWRFTDGILDELRISTVPRSPQWIAAQYLSMKNEFITYTAEETREVNKGTVLIYYGSPSMEKELGPEDANITVSSDSNDDSFGYSMAFAGDLNKDGFDDIMIGAPGRNNNTGAAYIYYGRNSDKLKLDLMNADEVMYGKTAGEEFGCALAGCGDINADGYDDFIIGARKSSKAYVYFGGSTNYLTINGTKGDEFGSAVTGCGDVNADGYDDFLVGAPGNSTNTGCAYLFFGSNWQKKFFKAADSLSGVVFVGEAPGHNFGYSVAGAIRFNSDNYDDILIGAPNAGGNGTAYVFLGRTFAKSKVPAADADVSSVGEGLDDKHGWSVANIGNVDGQFFDDVIIGSPFYDDDYNSGKVYILYDDDIIKTSWIKTYNLFDTETIFFEVDETMKIRALVECPKDPDEIKTVNVTIIDPFKKVIIDDQPMNLEAEDKTLPLTWKLFNYTIVNPTIPGTYTVNVTSRDTTGNIHEESIEYYVKAGPPSELLISAEDEKLTADGAGSTNITVKAYDKFGNPITGIATDFILNLSAGGGSFGPVMEVGNGTYRFKYYTPVDAEPDAVINITLYTLYNKTTIELLPGPLSRIEISPASADVKVKQTKVFFAYGYDKFNNSIVLNGTKWSTNCGSILIDTDSNSLFEAQTTPCSGFVNASVGTINGSAKVNVTPGNLIEIRVTPDPVNVTANSTCEFFASGYDIYDNPIPLTSTLWSTNAGTITETANDFVRITAASTVGTGYVNATQDSLTGTSSVNIIPSELVKIEVSPPEITLIVGSYQEFEATGYDEFGNEVTISPTWSSDIGVMDGSKLITGTQEAEGKVYARVDDIVGSSEVIITHGSLDHIVVTPALMNLSAGDSQVFSATGYDRFDNPVVIDPVWSATAGSMEGATFSAPVFTCTVYVNATVGSVTGSAMVNVIPGMLNHILIVPAVAEVVVGGTQEFSAYGYDRFYNTVVISPAWTTNVGTIQDGRLSAQTKIGTGSVDAAVGEISCSAEVTIIPGTLVRIDVTPETAKLVAGTFKEFAAVGYDKFDNLVSISPIWYCDSSIGIMVNEILSVSMEVGTGQVTAACRGITDSANVTVIPDELEEIFVAPPTLHITVSKSQEFVAIGYDQYKNTVPISPAWSTDVGIMNGSKFTAQSIPGRGYVAATEKLNNGNSQVTGLAEVIVEYDLGPASLRPKIIGTIPNQEKHEDCPPWILDLSSFESDDSDSGSELRWFVTGIDSLLLSVFGEYSDDDRLTFTPVPDAYGSNEITLWLMDSDSYKDARNIWVNLTPVNDWPSIHSAPDLVVRYDDPYTFDFGPYVDDVETPKELLTISVQEISGTNYTTVSGQKITFNYPFAMLNKQVYVTVIVSDGEDTNKDIIKISITDNWVPKLSRYLPDVTLYEGTTIFNVFDLDDYFYDQDKDSLFYSYGQTHVEINIKPDHCVDITSESEWAGQNKVTFRAEDPGGALVEDTIIVTVLPINDPPMIAGVPDLVVHYDFDYFFELVSYVKDDDNATDDLKITTSDPKHIRFDKMNHFLMIVNYPESYNNNRIPIYIRVSDGIESASQLIFITVSDNFPPEIKSHLPDFEFEEDSQLNRIVNLDQYFTDRDGDYLYYSYGYSNIQVTINDDNTVSFAALPDWNGVECITFRAKDPGGALAEDTVFVTVIPVNDAPRVAKIPDQAGFIDDMWVLDLSGYISDVDNNLNDLRITVNSEVASVSGLKLLFFSEKPMKRELVVDVTDGSHNTSRSFTVTFKPHDDVVSVSSVINWSIIFIIIILLISLLFVYRKYHGNYIVEEIFLIYENGNLLAHRSNKHIGLKDEDKEIISSMFTAVQDFVKDSFDIDSGLMKTVTGTKNEWQLQQLNMGGHRIIIEHGSRAYLAVIYSGTPGWKLNQLLQLSMSEIEKKYFAALSDWDGNMEKLKGIEYLLKPLVES